MRSFYNSDSEQLTREKDDSCSCDGHRAVYNLSKFLLLSIRGFLSVSLFWWLELSNFQSESQIASIYLGQCFAPIYRRERRFFDICIPDMRLRNNGSNVGPTILLQNLFVQGDGEGKKGNRKDRK